MVSTEYFFFRIQFVIHNMSDFVSVKGEYE